MIAGFLSCVVCCVCRSHRLEIYFRNKPLKIFVSETIGPEALISSGPLQSLFLLCPWGKKWACTGGHLFYIRLCIENP